MQQLYYEMDPVCPELLLSGDKFNSSPFSMCQPCRVAQQAAGAVWMFEFIPRSCRAGLSPARSAGTSVLDTALLPLRLVYPACEA